MQGINLNFFSVLLVFSLSACSNAADYKPQQLDEKTVYKNSEHDLNNTYSDRLCCTNLSVKAFSAI